MVFFFLDGLSIPAGNMISAPDVVAFTKEEEFEEPYSEFPALPEEYSVPLFPFANNVNPWSKLSAAKFTRDFILISEFSEQVGPQPLLTIPDDHKVYGTFDLNYFSLRIMSVDYQASFVGHPPGSAYPKLNFVEDSKVVLGDSKEGAFAYVHHLTLYDLEARGFVRPFCMAYISTDEHKIMLQFQELSLEFSKASECLKTGNRKAFANELEKKLKDLNYTRTVLHNELELQKKTSDKGFYTTQAIEKANELANVEKSIIEHQDLLKQIRSYPYRKLKDTDFQLYDPEYVLDQSNVSLDQTSVSSPPKELPEDHLETNCYTRRPSYTPKLIKAKSAKCFDKKLKTLEELCDIYFFNQTLDQLTQIEKTYRGDVCYLLTSQTDKALLKQQTLTNFLFEDASAWEEKLNEKQYDENLGTSLGTFTPKSLEEPQSLNASASLDSYKSSVESVPIKLEQEVVEEDSEETKLTASNICDNQEQSECLDTDIKGSISSGESIEVLRTEKSASVLNHSESQPCLQNLPSPQVVRSKAVSRRTISGDSIEILSTCTSESLIPEDFKASYPSAINEEEPCAENEEEGGLQNLLTNFNLHNLIQTEAYFENETVLPVDASCCIGKESSHFLEPPVDHAPTFGDYDDGDVVSSPPQPYKQLDQGFHVNFSVEDVAYSSNGASGSVALNEQDVNYLTSGEEASRVSLDEHSDSTSYRSSASTSSDRTPSPAHPGSHLTERQKKRAGQNALRFIRQYPFAHPAIFSLLSGRTLLVLGEKEAIVKKLVTALSIFVPSYGKTAKPVRHWVTSPLHIMDFQKWKLIGLQRVVSPSGCNVLYSLNRYSRYVSVLDIDSKTLRCPLYKGTLLPRLADHRTQIKRGSTYYLHVQSVLTQLCSMAFLYTFCHHLHLPISEKETEETIALRRMNFLRLHLGLASEDIKVVQYLAELLKMHYLQESGRGIHPVLRFDYVPSLLYKI
ncbi:guanine nucleotide exchange protein SMCR8 [Rhinatrema bivittatum]|uniref:guanine nucleotide exchange protein SMCR8 n=1 Tax=Rhinatrema bivittatum TaxID=194408 RepID=UPI00112BA2DA|nr:guanine nucleotide exchange protein SMCR8 [Rhinatrema bivittatum]